MKKISYSILSEILFIVLPILVLATIYALKKDYSSILQDPAWSFGAIVLFGQTIVKYVSGLIKCKKKIIWQKPILIISLLIVLGLIPSVVLLSATLLLPTYAIGLMYVQLVNFLIGCAVYYTLGGTGEFLAESI